MSDQVSGDTGRTALLATLRELAADAAPPSDDRLRQTETAIVAGLALVALEELECRRALAPEPSGPPLPHGRSLGELLGDLLIAWDGVVLGELWIPERSHFSPVTRLRFAKLEQAMADMRGAIARGVPSVSSRPAEVERERIEEVIGDWLDSREWAEDCSCAYSDTTCWYHLPDDVKRSERIRTLADLLTKRPSGASQ